MPNSVANIKPRLRPILSMSNAAGILVSMIAIKITAIGSVASALSGARLSPTSAAAVSIRLMLLIISA